ncbi:MAG TPA: hypothetical protein VE442_12640 [Jatrophihabitans sp.]|jgi:hypothetical protein|nr:hypothetical protein [Jatrophihabitans sp.]
MRYVLGTESEAMAFSGVTVDYSPAGLVHAVDTKSAQFHAGCAVGYAVCGVAVRVWQDRPFKPHTDAEVDAECASVAGKKSAIASGEQEPSAPSQT